MPALIATGLRPAQIEAVTGIERSLAEQRFDRSLVQMATGAGKTFTAVTSSYRLLKHGGFRRVLFLVDRNNLTRRFESSRTTPRRTTAVGSPSYTTSTSSPAPAWSAPPAW